jgi:hypothetical protein
MTTSFLISKKLIAERLPAEIFFSATFSLPRKKLPFPAVIFDGRSKPGRLPEQASSPVLAEPQELSFPKRPLTPPPAPNSPSTFPPPSVPSTCLGNPASSADLAVFPEDQPVPEEALRVLWFWTGRIPATA